MPKRVIKPPTGTEVMYVKVIALASNKPFFLKKHGLNITITLCKCGIVISKIKCSAQNIVDQELVQHKQGC
jgi:hypothetical protein